MAGEVAAGVGAQEPGERADVELGIALAFHRAVLDEDPVALALLAGLAVMRRRGRCDRVHDDAVGRPLAAAVRVSARIASFDALYAAKPAPPVMPIDDAKLTTPPLRKQ